MDKSLDEAAFESNSTPPDAKRPRRCVQSKLFWHIPGSKVAEGTVGDDEVGEPRGSEEKKKNKKSRRKSQTPTKCPVTSKVAQRSSARNKKSLVVDPDYSPKTSKESLQEEQKTDQEDALSLKMGKGKHCKDLESIASKKNSRKLKNKQNGEATPKKATPKKATPKKSTRKKATTSLDLDSKGAHSQQRITSNKSDTTKNLDGQTQHIHQPVFDLRLEAKIAAEENVKLSAGKETHPFFTIQKARKRVPEAQDTTKVEKSNPNSDYLVSGPPIHIFDTRDDVVSLDWKNWVFMDRSVIGLNGYHALENTSVFEGSVEPLKLDTKSCDVMHMDQLSDKLKKISTSTTSCDVPNGKDTNEQLVSSLNLANDSINISLPPGCFSLAGKLRNDQQDNLLMGRVASYYQRCSYSPDCSLWTNKYQPKNALEVCGNKEPIESLSEWLKSWHERGQDSTKHLKYDDQCTIQDSEDSLYGKDSDMDEVDDDASLKNVLLITGPIGSGKSAAIYACAKEQGFEVLEVNSSDLRSGSHVKQKYGEAMESHGFNRWSCEDPIDPRKKNILELLSSSSDIREDKQVDYSSLEITSNTCNQDELLADYSSNDTMNKTVLCPVANKTLILFEDVDTVFNEDRGFISTIQQLSETSKRPIILTSNNKKPVLPHMLDRLILDFTLPSYGELLPHVHMICAAEKVQVSSHLLEQLIKSCLGDIRKTLMLLQFWCQGKGGIDRNMLLKYSPLPCDVDAAHLVMPRVLPWEFQCELSRKVEEEISKTISKVEERLWSTETVDFSNIGNTVKTRKNRSLKRKLSFHDCTEVTANANNGLEDFNDVASPVTSARRRVKHKPGVVSSSESDGQSDDDNLPPSNIIPEIATVPSLQIQGMLNNSELPITIRDPLENLETASPSHICDTFKLQEMSCVPESSFFSVAETKRDGLAISSNNVSVTFADFLESIHAPPGKEVHILDKDLEKINCDASYEIEVESVHENEELGDSQTGNKEPPGSRYQMMDECSRVDFSVVCPLEVDSVQDTWRRLRGSREDLNAYLPTNQKDACSIVKLASELTDLISETDIMLSTCSHLSSDILEPSRTPPVEPDAFSWYEKHFEMGSTYSQHGLCLYTQKCAMIGSNLGCEGPLNLAQEMLCSSNNTMALGKLLTCTPTRSSAPESTHRKAPESGISIGRGVKSELYDVVRAIVPTKSSMTLRGHAFHDYLAFMSQISRLEQSPLSERRTRRCTRASRCYLSSGLLQLSPERVELLARSGSFKSPRRQLFQ